MLMGGRWIPTVLDTIRDKGEEINADEIVFAGYNNIRCVEAGGPEPGVGCAGRGIIATFQLLEKLDALYGDVIVYDILGDVVCVSNYDIKYHENAFETLNFMPIYLF